MSEAFVEISRPETVWRFERAFLESNWVCLFGNGCQGILGEPAPELNQGCCSIGAHFGDGEPGEAEAMNVSAYASMLRPDQWQYHGVDTVFSDGKRNHTRVVDGACVFLNRPGFAGGEGCALHIAAVEWGESPTEWKPSVCWQLPIRVDWEVTDPELRVETATVRRWTRADWGAQGTTMAWCCTERDDGGEAFSGAESVLDSMSEELTELAGEDVYLELRRRITDAPQT